MHATQETPAGPPSYLSKQQVPQVDVHTEEFLKRSYTEERWARAKLSLGIASISNSMLVLALACGVAGGAGNPRNMLSLYVAPLALGTVAWNVAEMARLIATQGRGIVAGAHIGIRLILCLAWSVEAGILPGTGYLARWRYDQWVNREYGTSIDGLGWMVVALCCAGAMIEMVLFVRACFEEHWRLQGKRSAEYAAVRKAAGLDLP